jgi:DNA-directed RNA polymerase subunit RPC12/RpoP
METYKCCICGKEFTGWGNNPWPVKNSEGKDFGPNDRCCNECNSEFVIPARITQYFKEISKEG